VSRPWIVDDELRALIEPLLPAWPSRRPGRKPIPDRLCLQGVLFVLYTEIGWEQLPQELGFGSGMTCWRRLERWCRAGVFDRLHRLLLARLHAAGELDWSRVCIDASHVKAKRGGAGVGPSPVDRGKPGSKHHIVCDGQGLPLKVITTGGNVPDIAMAEALIGAIPPVAGRIGRPRSKPDAVLADKGYDSAAFRSYSRTTRHSGGDIAAQTARHHWSWQPSLGRGTRDRSSAPVQTPHRSLGAPARAA
jgi:transposase